jgi:UDP-N-acetylmuramoylalanine--D-glutamate ligase
MKIAIAGFGQEGKASYDYWNTAENELTIADERAAVDNLPENAATILGEDAFSKLGSFDRIIRSPGVNPKKLPYDQKVWSATNEFFERCPAPIIGVTGTKGKGTTCSLIASILRAAGRNVHLVGNIGVPSLSELAKITPDDIVVFELSSFQLWDVKKSPHVAVVLMIEPDHLEVHNGMDDYIAAKANIVKFQTATDITIYNQNNDYSVHIGQQSLGQKIAYPDRSVIDRYAEYIKIPGKHNLDNMSAAIAAIKQYVAEPSQIQSGLASFTGLPHRLKFVAEKNEVKYYDDSIATTPGSAIAALASFEEPKLIILGGYAKGADYTELIAACNQNEATVIAIGTNGAEIAQLCTTAGVSCIQETGDMTAIVKRASEAAEPGSVVLLSPAAASFDMFKSYADRGDQFAAAVDSL